MSVEATASVKGSGAPPHGRIRRRNTTIADLPAAPRADHVSFLSGLLAGTASAGLFNPLDRALYLSVKNDVPFLSCANFRQPYAGFLQSVGHRALSGGLYFPLEQLFVSRMVTPRDASSDSPGNRNIALHNFLAGTAAGSASAVMFNPLSAIKYKTWGREVPRTFLAETAHILRNGGVRPFFNGMLPTVLRDLVFGGCYTLIRFELQYRLGLSNGDYQWAANFVAAALATVASGPFNLARNLQYATSSRRPADPIHRVLIQFVRETIEMPTALQRLRHIQSRLRIGWGTARVALGMSFGHYVYDQLQGLYYHHEGQK